MKSKQKKLLFQKIKRIGSSFSKLFNYPQPEQRSEGWYKYRKSRITASDTATAIDLNPYEPVEHFIVKKIDPDRIHSLMDLMFIMEENMNL